MKNAFLDSNLFNRKFGGKQGINSEPYVTGTHFIWFKDLPSELPKKIPDLSISQIRNVLTATCLSVTPPGGTLNKIEFTGLGGIKWSVPGNVDYGTSVTVKFFEFQSTPLLNIIHNWIKLIRDYRTGVSNLITNNSYNSGNYAGTLYYFTTAPNGKDIEYYAAYDNVFPLKDPQDLFSSDVETQGKLDIEIEFNCDNPYHEDWVKAECEGFLGIITKGRDIIEGWQR